MWVIGFIRRELLCSVSLSMREGPQQIQPDSRNNKRIRAEGEE